jgi:hypothetical protein
MPPPAPINVRQTLDVLWRDMGGVTAVYRQLVGYAMECIKNRSTASVGGQRVAQLQPEEIVNGAIEKALLSDNCPTQGKELYWLVRRNIDNPLRTLEKSPNAMRTMAVGDDPSAGEVTVVDEDAESPAQCSMLDEEDAFNGRVVEETRRRLKRPNCLEARLLDLVLERAGDKPKLCLSLGIDATKFDRVKHTLKTVIGGVINDLKRTERR